MTMVREAVILAAGRGCRFGERTKTMPKGFIEFDGVPIIKRSIRFLLEAGIERIIIGTGHCREFYEQLAEEIPQIVTVFNPHYITRGSMGTLEACAPYVTGDTLLLESDLLYERRALDLAIGNPRPDLILASGTTHSGDEVYLEVDELQNIRKISKKPEELSSIFAELVGITKLTKNALNHMCAYAESQRETMPAMEYESALFGIRAQHPIGVFKVEDLVWCEIDDETHLKRAETIIYPRLKS